jgi:DNA polymerase-3 subunit epsilon
MPMLATAKSFPLYFLKRSCALRMSALANEPMPPHKVLVFDTETSGLPLCPRFGEYYAIDDLGKYESSRLVQIAWQVIDLQNDNEIVREYQTLVSPQGSFRISQRSTNIHGISQEHAESKGVPVKDMLEVLARDISDVDIVVAHNLAFDIHILASEMVRAGTTPPGLLGRLMTMPSCCTMRTTTRLCNLTTSWGAPKWPRLLDLHRFLFDGDSFEGAHDALADVRAASKCLIKLLQSGMATVTY